MRFGFLALAILLASPLYAQPTREELTETPGYVEEAARPAYRKLTHADLEAIRNIRAVTIDDYGNVLHAVRFPIPAGHNALHAIATFDPPQLTDADGNRLDPDAFSMKMDFDEGAMTLPYLGSYDPAPDVRSVKGKLILRYPLSVTTETIKAGDKGTRARLGVEIDGPFVRFDDARVSTGRWVSDFRSVRAYDASGKQLADAGVWADEEGSSYLAVMGNVAKVEIDMPGELAAVLVDYEVDPSKPDAPAKVNVSRLPSLSLPVLGQTVNYHASQLEGYVEGFTGTLEERLFAATTEGDEQAVRFLLALGAQVDGNATSAMTPFTTAAMLTHEEVAMLLLEAGADMNPKDPNGVTPLMHIITNCPSAALVQRMIDRGADVKAKGFGGVTLLAMAEAGNCTDAAAVLKKAGAR